VGNAFFSLLVEEGYFEEIELFYLVVGHTHNRLDQWFSVLSKAIANSEYIGSVIALHSLYMIAHQEKEKDKRPSRVEQLYCYHDWAEYLAPVINDKIKHYQVPHRTKFSRVNGKCIMQYMLFSPEYGMYSSYSFRSISIRLHYCICRLGPYVAAIKTSRF